MRKSNQSSHSKMTFGSTPKVMEERNNIIKKDFYKLKAAFIILAFVNLTSIGLLIAIVYNQARECSKLQNEIETIKRDFEFFDQPQHKEGIIIQDFST